MIARLIADYGSEMAMHLAVSTVILSIVLAAATWIRPPTARTRHAILIAGMAALLLPPAIFARHFERLAGERVGAMTCGGGSPSRPPRRAAGP